MSGLFGKSINLGIGIFAFSKEKIEKLVDELVEKGEVKKNDAKEFLDELIDKGAEQREEIKSIIREVVRDSLCIKNSKDNEELRELIREEVLKVIKEQELVSKKDI